MAARAILLVAAAIFLLDGFVCADATPALPSRKASVVMPLLNQLSAKDSPETILNKVGKILGTADPVGAGPHLYLNGVQNFYALDNGTQIVETFENGKFVNLLVEGPKSTWLLLYKAPKS